MNSKTFSALAEPTRFRIIELLKDRSYSVNEFAALLNINQPQASKHLQALSRAGLVIVRPVAQQRIYALNPDAFIQLDEWAKSFSATWNERLDSLGEHLKTVTKKG